MDLHPHEIKLLRALAIKNGLDVPGASKISGLNPDSIRKAVLWASAKGLVKPKTEIKKTFHLTAEGERWTDKNTLPEIEIYKEVLNGSKNIAQLKKLDAFTIGFMWAKKKGMINISGDAVTVNKPVDMTGDVNILKRLKQGHYDAGAQKSEEMKRRGLVEERIEKTETIFITKTGLSAASGNADDKIGKLTPDVLESGEWKTKGLREYDATLPANAAMCGKRHITSVWVDKIRKIFLDMGFKEAAGPLVESSFWCFDALYQPQDHPSREMADTFFMKNPRISKLPKQSIVNAVKTSHENGIEGSTGWKYKWSEDIAKKPVLRTHTTAVSARSLYGLTPPAKIFCIGRIFRNETIDYKHLTEFTQIDGVVADENVTFRDLLGYLKEFYWRMGFEKIRFRPAYFPYTEMSVEPEVYFEERGEWMELGGAGVFRPEVTNPLGVDVPVLAWGLGVERPIVLRTGLNDLRNFYFKNDLKLLRNSKVTI